MYYPHSSKAGELSDAYEFIELKNTSATESIDLAGVYFNKGILYPFPNTAVLQPNGLLVLASNPTAFKERYGFAPFSRYLKNLDNSGEQISLTDAYGRTIDEVQYNDKKPWAAADSTGYSLELISPSLDNALASSWTASKKKGGSPGENTITATENIAQNTVIKDLSAHPNPLTYNSVLRYTLNSPQSVQITLFDLNGKKINEIQGKEIQNEGIHSYSLRFMENLSAGMYLVKVNVGGQELMVKVMN
jgi:hypothetical protein